MTPKTPQWLAAQKRERELHCLSVEEGKHLYRSIFYENYFKYLGMDWNIPGRRIIEVGPADFPALAFCTGYDQGIVIEPMPSLILKEIIISHPILLIQTCAEDYDFPKADEVWIFNVLQHVLNPMEIIEKAKAASPCVRFFEPINYKIDIAHIHMFSHDFFVRAFGDVVEHYSGTKEGVKGFHTAECAYGTWWNPPRPKKVVAHEDTTNPNYDHAAGRVIIK